MPGSEAAALVVRRPGLLTTVQDLGRPGWQRHGIPVGGALDAAALRIGNLLVGNEEGDAGLEATLVGPSLTFQRDVLVAVTGGRLGPRVDDQPIPEWQPLRVRAGATLSFAGAGSGCRVYIAVAGGLAARPVLGSRGTYLRARIGGLEGRALRAGDRLGLGEPSPLARRLMEALDPGTAAFGAAGWGAGPGVRPPYRADPVLGLMRGPHLERLTPESREALAGAPFRVAADSDRMGYRLEGRRLELAEPLEVISEPVAAGTVQLPPGGKPIVLLADCQTTGGYPILGYVATADLPLVAQTRPGDAVRFREISLEEAEQLYLAAAADIEALRRAIRLRVGAG